MNDMTLPNGNLPAINDEQWASQGTSNEDLLIPRVLCMQDISKLVKDEKAKSGYLVHGVTQEILAERGQSLEIIPVTTFREWQVMGQDERKPEKWNMLRRELITPANEGLPVEDNERGQAIKRIKALNFFVLLANRLEEMPFLISFKKSSLYAGKKLSTHFQMSRMKKQAPAGHVFKLSTELRSWDSYSFYALDVQTGRPSTQHELDIARTWYGVLSKQEVKVAEDDFMGEDGPRF